jgi:NADPH-dependent 2,4-dienoyl-CoA reductase/sulfur reductase-like enzyme
VTLLEKGRFISYAGCGLPYYVSGMVKEQKDLMSTPVGVLRDPAFFQKVKGFKVLAETEALEIDRARKRVRARRKGETGGLMAGLRQAGGSHGGSAGYSAHSQGDPGEHQPHCTVVPDADGIKAWLAQAKAREVVMIGGGLIGVEAVEALAECDCHVTVVEMLPQILRMLDWEMARLVERHMESQGVTVMTNTKVDFFRGRRTRDGSV